jgi:SAM-dependent methyltransferase
MKKVLDLGCGCDESYKPMQSSKEDEVTRLDIKGPYANVIHDMNKYPYPFQDNEFDEIYLNHSDYYVEDKNKLMSEIRRIAKPNAKIVIRSIHFSRWDSKKRQAKHPFFINVDSFNEFRDKFETKEIALHYFLWHTGGLKRIASAPIDFLANVSPKFCERVWCYWVGGFEEISGILIKK